MQPVAASLAPPPSPAAPSPACPDATELAWLDKTEMLRVTIISDGHFGYSEFHAVLHGEGKLGFYGTVTLAFRDRPDDPARVVAKSVKLANTDVGAFLTAMRDASALPADANARGTVIHDSSTSERLYVVADYWPDWEPHKQVMAKHVELVGRGEEQPNQWGIRGCDHGFSFPAGRKAATKAFAAFLGLLGHDALRRDLDRARTGKP